MSVSEKLTYLEKARSEYTDNPEEVLKVAASLVRKGSFSLGESYWTVCEDLFYASLSCNTPQWTNFAISELRKKFGRSHRVLRLEGVLHEYSGKFSQAQEIYDSLLASSPLDSETWKRKAALFRTAGNIQKSIAELNAYLEVFQGDLEAWEELCDIYLSMQHYLQACYCYEEIVLSNPHNPQVLLKYAEMLYSTGVTEKLNLARKYFTQVLVLNPKNVRAMWGLYQASTKTNNEKSGPLREKAKVMLVEAYKESPININLLEI